MSLDPAPEHLAPTVVQESVEPEQFGRRPGFFGDPGIHFALILFLASRLGLSLWAILVLTFLPLPAEPNEVLRPYLGQPILEAGAAGWLLGPWQRFDSQHYLRIAEQGYAEAKDSVFPPLYPLAINGVGRLFGIFLPQNQANLLAAILIANAAFLVALAILYRLTAADQGDQIARRTLVYLTFFPTAFFLLAAYSESLFLLLALGCLWAGRNGRFWLAGLLGLLAALTRLTGWILVAPLLYEYFNQRGFQWRRLRLDLIATVLPAAGATAFVFYRSWLGLPDLGTTYKEFWYQVTRFPGRDLITAAEQMLAGGAPFRLYFDMFCAILLLATTIIALRRLRLSYGLYALMLLLFIFLPSSELKPLFSFGRYALVFFPTFILLAEAGQKPWQNRLILYPSLALYLYFSGQFFIWGWVA